MRVGEEEESGLRHSESEISIRHPGGDVRRAVGYMSAVLGSGPG